LKLRKSSGSKSIRPLDEYCTIIAPIRLREGQGAKLALKIDHRIAGTESSGRDDPPDKDAMAADNLMLLQHAIDGADRRIQQRRTGYALTPRRIPESVRTTDAVKAREMPRQRLLSGSEQTDAKVPIGEETTPGCPAIGYLKEGVANSAWSLPDVEFVDVQITFEPAWKPEMMTVQARADLGFAAAN
jgi:hypothetical protein